MHLGTGASTGGIDLPLAREVGTGWPLIPGSGIKGVLRNELVTEHTDWLFGSKRDATSDRDQGALMFSDLRLLCLPVRSYAGGWAWVTSPAALQAYAREAKWCQPGDAARAALPVALPAEPASDASVEATVDGPLAVSQAIFLHDIRLRVTADEASKASVLSWATHLADRVFAANDRASERTLFLQRFVLVSEAVFAYLATVAMDVRTRVRLEVRKAVATSGPWVEESLPVETLLWGSVAADAIKKSDNVPHSAAEAISAFSKLVGAERRLQIGGKATVGRGVARFIAVPPAPSTGAEDA